MNPAVVATTLVTEARSKTVSELMALEQRE